MTLVHFDFDARAQAILMHHPFAYVFLAGIIVITWVDDLQLDLSKQRMRYQDNRQEIKLKLRNQCSMVRYHLIIVRQKSESEIDPRIN